MNKIKVGDIIIRRFGNIADWMQGSSYLIVEITNEPNLELKCMNLRTGNFRYVGKEFLNNRWKRL